MADLAVVILAAGLGTRMKSATPKVFHGIAGRPMLAWVQETARGLSPQKLLTILGPEASETSDLGETDLGETLIQKERRGTGHAVQLAASRLAGFEGWVLVLYGDTALVQTQVLADMLTYGQDQGADLVVAGFRPADPGHYARLIVEGGQVQAIVEYKDASPTQRQISLCNGGLMAFRAQRGLELLDQLSDQNAAGEFYLTDLVALMRAAGGKTCVYDFPAEDLMGVNTRAELAQVEALMQSRLRAQHMAAGVTFVDPASVTLAYDTKIGADTVLEPYQVFGPGVKLGAQVTVRAHCHMEGAEVGDGAVVGPYARLRPGTKLSTKARVGNFVEVKNATLGPRAKANHLTYLGDAEVGAGANIGAGTITCNYDGFNKHRTRIGAGAFIGSNSALVAPIDIGEGAIVGAGSTLTQDVAHDALVVARAPVRQIAGGAAQLRKKLAKSRA